MKMKTPEQKHKEEAKIITTRSRGMYSNQNKKAKIVGELIRYTVAHLREAILKAIGLKCPYCETCITPQNFSSDHRIPTSRGGQHDIANIVICCLACNQRKGILTDTEYMDLLG